MSKERLKNAFFNTFEEKIPKTLAGSEKSCLRFAASEMTNPVFSAWG